MRNQLKGCFNFVYFLPDDNITYGYRQPVSYTFVVNIHLQLQNVLWVTSFLLVLLTCLGFTIEDAASRNG